jgi:arsenate reductase (thioredoxin)
LELTKHMQNPRSAVTYLLMFSTVVAAGTAQTSGLQRNTATTPTRPTVLFLCPHGAAKSVLASAYFQTAAKERGLNVRVGAAGTDPQDQVSPAVVNRLRQNGYQVPVKKPRKVTANDIETADVIISMGCDVSALNVPTDKLRRWDDVPGPSEDLNAADNAIRRRVMALVEELLAQQKR